MNEPRFIELLNLYVDQQLSPQEAAELEAEIQTNPVRHRTYQQYCRMQKACAQLFEHERSAAPASAALSRAMADADRKIVAFPEQGTRRSIWPVGFSIGAVAAAACVAFVVLRQSNTDSPVSNGGIVAMAESVPDVQSRAAAVPVALIEEQKPVLSLAATDDFKSVFIVQPLRSASAKPAGLFVSGSTTADVQLLDWTHEVQLKPLRKVSAEEFSFNQRAAADKRVKTQFSPTTEEPATEEVGFQFTK